MLKSDPFVATIIDGVDDGLAQNGVKTRLQLAEQLLEVRETARKLSLVPQDGGGMFAHGLSYAASLLRVKDTSDEGAQGIEGAIAKEIHTWLPAAHAFARRYTHKRSGGYKSRRFCERVGAECSRARPIRASTNRVKRSRAMQSIGACLETAL